MAFLPFFLIQQVLLLFSPLLQVLLLQGFRLLLLLRLGHQLLLLLLLVLLLGLLLLILPQQLAQQPLPPQLEVQLQPVSPLPEAQQLLIEPSSCRVIAELGFAVEVAVNS